METSLLIKSFLGYIRKSVGVEKTIDHTLIELVGSDRPGFS